MTEVDPDMLPGCSESALTLIANVLGVLEPHELSAVTEIVPLIAPAVAVIDVELELPLQPDGKVQVYEVAPDTAEIVYV